MTAEKSLVVDSRWSRILEYSVFAFPVMLGLMVGALGAVGLRGSATAYPGAGMAGIVVIGGLLASVLGLVLTAVIAVSLYFDAQLVEEADTEWSPSPVLYAVGGLVFSGLVALHYLYERHKHLSMPVEGNKWWYGVALSLAFTAVGLLSGVAALPVGSMFVLSAVTAFLLPIAIYKDAAHVRTHDDGWTPNPVNYFLVTFFTFPLLVVAPLAGGYYLFKRHRHVGLN